MSQPAIRVEGLGKMYRIGGPVERYKTFRDTVAQGVARLGRRLRGLVGGNGAAVASKYETIWALKDVSFEIEPGEVVGVIGRNGAGKSTLLKILSRITEPTEGRVEIRGRVGSLLEVGTGFHPELTGRENVYLNGAILGMKRAEVDRKFDEIVAFAEIEKFVDTPVKHYSSGMYVRLAFSVAAHLDTDILLVDEVLAVGDSAFQKKCLGRMEGVRSEGRTVFLVSHNLLSIESICTRALWIERGAVVDDGGAKDVIENYIAALQPAPGGTDLAGRIDRRGEGGVRVISMRAMGPDGNVVRAGQPMGVEVLCLGRMPMMECRITMYDLHGAPLQSTTSGGVAPKERGSEEIVFRCEFAALYLQPGEYMINVAITAAGRLQDHLVNALRFRVEPGLLEGAQASSGRFGSLLLPHRWTCEG